MRTNTARILAGLMATSLLAGACTSDGDSVSTADEATTETTAEVTTTEAAMEENSMEDDAMEDDSADHSGDDAMADDEDAMADEDDAMADDPGTIVDVAAGNGSFTTLVAAVQAAGLVDTLSSDGPFTVFAPTDDAFATALDALGLTAEQLLADTDLLTSVLTYHVIAGEVPASQVVTLDGQSVATVNGAEVTIGVNGDTVTVNEATVTAVDVKASNGLIHVIDTVLLPPADGDAMADESGDGDAMADDPGTIVDVAVANGSFTTLVAAVQAAGLVDTLSSDGPFTVFAPTDDAFATALDALGLTAEQLLADTDLLTSVLTYHVIAGEVPASQVVTLDGQSVATVNGAEVTIGVNGDTVTVNEATVTAVDVKASNGLIHVIDTVLLPPS